MRKMAFLGCVILLYACGTAEQTETDRSDESENMELIEELSEDSNKLVSSNEYQPSKWQITDYAEFFEDACIEDNQDEIDWNDPKSECRMYYETKDVKGGFVSIRGGMEGWIEYVMFRMADGRDLVCRMAVDCGPACGYNYKFYYCNSEINTEAGDELFPMAEMRKHQEVMYQKGLKKYGDFDYSEDNQLHYIFPQKGTSMEVNLILGADEIEYPILKLGWNKTNFYIEELYHQISEAY